MAEEKELELDVEIDDEKSNKKVLIFIIAGAVALIGITVGLTLFLLGGDEEVPAEGEEAAVPEVVQLQYFDMKPAFTVNFHVDNRARILQMKLSLAYRDDSAREAVELHMPLIRHNLINLISSEDFNSLRTLEGREALRQKILESVQQVIEQETGEAGVENVLFTNFVMQ